jgi:hypothetical protein
MKKELGFIIIFLLLSTIFITGCTNQEKSSKYFIVSSPSFVNESESFVVTITDNGTPLDNVNVIFDDQTNLTNSSGKVQFSAPKVIASKVINITAEKEGYIKNTTSIMVWNIPKIIITIPENVTAGQNFSVIVRDDNGADIVGASVTFNGYVFISGAAGVTELIAPMHHKATYAITAVFPGYRSAIQTVEIV